MYACMYVNVIEIYTILKFKFYTLNLENIGNPLFYTVNKLQILCEPSVNHLSICQREKCSLPSSKLVHYFCTKLNFQSPELSLPLSDYVNYYCLNIFYYK